MAAPLPSEFLKLWVSVVDRDCLGCLVGVNLDRSLQRCTTGITVRERWCTVERDAT
jgi:hypothetical protein